MRTWISCGLLAVLVAFGGIRLTAQTSAPESNKLAGVILESPTVERPQAKNVLRQTAAQLPPPKGKLPAPEEGARFVLRLDLPGPEILFRLESEAELRRRIRQEKKGQRQEFPDSRIVLSKSPFTSRDWDPMEEVVEPYYSVYRRLYFEQINTARYGWDFGYFAPAIALGTFYFDFATLPFQLIAEPCRRYEYNSGLCLPGDPVPLYLYPPHPK
jgi:hypothetical protein